MGSGDLLEFSGLISEREKERFLADAVGVPPFIVLCYLVFFV